MERKMSCVTEEKVKYNGLIMVEMTYEEAYKFAKQYGMNAIVYNKQTEEFNLYRVTRSGENLEMTKEGLWGYRTEPVDREKHIIYWVGGKETRSVCDRVAKEEMEREIRNKEKEYYTKSKFDNKKDVDNAIASMLMEEEDFKWRNNL